MILYLKPYFSSRPWHGTLLSKIYECPQDTGEAWICSGYHEKSSIINNREYQGLSLEAFFNEHKSDLFHMENEKEFPILMKIIDADEDLSVQVHPDNDYAKTHHNANGKFESWYFLPGNKASKVVVGLKCQTKEELKKIIDEKRIMATLNYENIQSGSYLSIKPGTVHALKGGSLVLETQQPSDITYRLYDYDRKPLRELHINDSLNVIDFENKAGIKDFSKNASEENKYFLFEKMTIETSKQIITNNNVQIVYIINGSGKINGNIISKYNTLLLIGEKIVTLEGEMEVALVTPKNK